MLFAENTLAFGLPCATKLKIIDIQGSWIIGWRLTPWI